LGIGQIGENPRGGFSDNISVFAQAFSVPAVAGSRLAAVPDWPAYGGRKRGGWQALSVRESLAKMQEVAR
jgi:hypothetical protein